MVERQREEETSVEALARLLDGAYENRSPIPPLSETRGVTSAEQAYAIQTRWTELRLERGERIIGRKIGLTSRVMREQMGVDEPDYGSLWASRYFPASRGRVEMPAEVFLQPRVEGEIAFLLGKPLAGKPLAGTDVGPQEVMAATEALAVAFEIIDSRIENWRIKLADTISDNASYGALTLGPWSRRLRQTDLRTLGMLIHHNGHQVVEGVGAAAFGHPARAVAWLANKLASFGVSLEPGDIVLSGSLGGSVPVRRGDVFMLELHGRPPLTAVFS